MEVVADIASLKQRPRALALGTFDGVHAGHRAVIGRAVELATERGLTCAVLTFDRHPLSIVDPSRVPRLLTSNEEKVRLIEELGPDELIMLPFDEQMAALTPAEFCNGLLAGSLGAKAVVVGENFNFGARGAGDAGAAAHLRSRARLRRRGLPAGHRARRADQLHPHQTAPARR